MISAMQLIGNGDVLLAAFIVAQLVGALAMLVAVPIAFAGSAIMTVRASAVGLPSRIAYVLVATVASSVRFANFCLAGIAAIYIGMHFVGWFRVGLWIGVPLILNAIAILQSRS